MESAIKNHSSYPDQVLSSRPRATSTPVGAIRLIWHRFTHWETWDWRIKYILIAPAWAWFCLRARSFWFFTASNPSLTFGGFDGESKKEMYQQLPEGSFPKSIYPSCTMSFAEVLSLVNNNRFNFPFAAKPDVGKMGFMFRKINSPDELKAYHAKIGCDYIIQEWVDWPIEVSVFYYRLPSAQQGVITGFIRKDFLEVTGDGRSTLWDLILRYPRAQFRIEEMRAKHKDKLHTVLGPGERYCLSPALNLSRGGQLVSLEREKDEGLLRIFDNISHFTGKFFYGRYDIKCLSIEDLRKGKNFCILEYNGSGAEPHHVYGNGYNLWQACGILIAHWQILCQISRLNRKSGVPYWEFGRGWMFLKNASLHLKKLKAIDSETAHN